MKIFLAFIILSVSISCTRQETNDTVLINKMALEVYPQLGHHDPILSIAVSPDGKQIVSGSKDHTLKLWDTDTGREIRTFNGHTDVVGSVAFSPDGKYVLSGSGNKNIDESNNCLIKLWDVETGRDIRTYTGHTNAVTSVAFSPNGKIFLSASKDSTLILWDIETKLKLKIFNIGGQVDSAVFSPDGKYILSSSAVWFTVNTSDDNSKKTDEPSKGGASDAWESYFSRRRNRKYCRMLILLDVETGEKNNYFIFENFPTFVTFSPDGKYILCGSDDNSLSLIDLETEKEKIFSKSTVTKEGITSVAFSPDGKFVISGSGDKTIKLWDVETGNLVRTFSGHTDGINSVAFSPDGKYIFSSSDDYSIKLWDVQTGQVIRTFFGYAGGSQAIAFHPNEKKMITGSRDYTVRLWDMETGREIKNFFGLRHEITSVAFSPSGTQILSGSFDGIVCFWNTATGTAVAITNMHGIDVATVAYSSDGKYTLSESMEAVNIINIDTLEIKTFKPEDRMIFRSAALSPDGKYFITGDYNDTLWLWDIERKEKIKPFKGHGYVNSVTFSPDGKYLLSGSDGKTIVLWDAETGQKIKTFSGHTAAVNSVAFSPDGKILYQDPMTIRLSTGILTQTRQLRLFMGMHQGLNQLRLPLTESRYFPGPMTGQHAYGTL